MPETYGTGEFSFNYAEPWAKLPDNMTFVECPGVAIDSQDNVFVLTRGEHPIVVFDREGNFLRTFGEGLFTNRTHGLYIAHDDSLLAFTYSLAPATTNFRGAAVASMPASSCSHTTLR
jgi:hypothetical protein